MNNLVKEFPNYFQDVKFNFNILDNMFEKQETISFLQIGAYTGDATTWPLNKYANQANFKLTDVDTWGQGDSKEMQGMDFAKIEKYYL